jgi:hypothetical protein
LKKEAKTFIRLSALRDGNTASMDKSFFTPIP